MKSDIVDVSEPTSTERDNHPAEPTHRSGKVIVVAFTTLIAGVALYFALGMPGMDHGSGSTMDGMDMSSEKPTHRLVDPAAFDAALDQPDVVVINVHVPYDGEVEGTDLFMPFDEIDAAALPTDRATPLVVYCRSGTMSADAVTALAGLGYTNIVELDGGMNAWQASGRTVAMNTTDD
jgi:rhodanese-related sulfurtransferase